MARKPAGPQPPSHPGVYVEGEIQRRLAAAPFALRTAADALEVNINSLQDLVRGKAGITPILALKLARVLGGTPERWMDAQRDYDLWRCAQAMGGKLDGLKPLKP